jgi:archaeal flagellar protein FlaJ
MFYHYLIDFILDTSYKLFGNLVPKLPFFIKDYNKSGIKIAFELYFALTIFSCITVSVVSFIISFLIESFLGVPFFRALLGTIVLALVATTLALTTLTVYPIIRMNKNKNEIDSNLIYTVGYMSVLSAGGIPIERIFERIIEVEPRVAIKELALRFTTNIKIFGADIVASLNDIQTRSASEVFSKLLLSMNNTSKTSGDLKGLLAFETNHLLALKREQLKKRLAGMVALAELYVTAMVMAPVTFIIMITLLSVLSTSSMSLSPVTQLNLIVFFGIPVICVIFIVILDGALPKED